MLRIFFKHLFLVIPLLFFLWPQIIYATDPPNLISPSDNSSDDKSPKLTWQYNGECIADGSCFRIEVDNNSDFSSPEKLTYTNSLSYSPQGLTEGNWNWRVKAKDKTDKWSDWSKVFKFTTGSSPAASYTASPQASPTPQATTASQKLQSSFTIKDIPSEINSNQEFEVSISLIVPNSPNQKFYLKGAFKKSDSSNYFGYTFSGDWVKNNSSYSSQFKIETDNNGKWDGKIKVRPDAEDSGFDGTGSYVFKVARYNESGGGLTWSNEQDLKIHAINIPQPSPSEKPETVEEETNNEEPDLTSSLVKAAPSRDYEIKIASVAGEATMSNNITLEEQTRVLEDKKINWLLITLGVGILGGGIGFAFYKVRKDRLAHT